VDGRERERERERESERERKTILYAARLDLLTVQCYRLTLENRSLPFCPFGMYMYAHAQKMFSRRRQLPERVGGRAKQAYEREAGCMTEKAYACEKGMRN